LFFFFCFNECVPQVAASICAWAKPATIPSKKLHAYHSDS
jgi:hypothetical protein